MATEQNFQKIEFMDKIQPLFDLKAVYSDGTNTFRCPMEPKVGEPVKLRLRIGFQNAEAVYIHINHQKITMEKAFSHKGFDYYQVEYVVGPDRIFYYFEIEVGSLTCYYDASGIASCPRQEVAFSFQPGFKTPDWAKGAVMYQIYPDRFFNGNPDNDVQDREYRYIGEFVSHSDSWNSLPKSFDVGHFFGGDIDGIIQKLDYLQNLGIEVLYLNPIFVSPSNHKYDIQDYDYIDPHLGRIIHQEGEVLNEDAHSNEGASLYQSRIASYENLEASNQAFRELVDEAHRRGMKVIIDGVFNHCGSFNKWLDREGIYLSKDGFEVGAYHSEDSPYRSYFHFNDNHWPQNKSYDGWWGHDTLPKLNYEESSLLEEKILSIGEKWVSPPFNVDGWRLDVAADLGRSEEYNHQFWKRFRDRVKAANPEAIIIAEHYGNASSWLLGDEWDTVMNYDAFMEPISWFLTGMEKHSDHFSPGLFNNADYFQECIMREMPKMQSNSRMVAMNQLDNHDHSRFLTRTNHKVGRVAHLGSEAAGADTNEGTLREAIFMQMTWFGAPTLYYGDEAGVVGFTDPDNRRTYPWGEENKGLINFYQTMIRLHKRFSAIKEGSYLLLDKGYGYLCYSRFTLNETLICAVNNTDTPLVKKVRVAYAGVERGDLFKRQVIFGGVDYMSVEEIAKEINEYGELEISVPAFGGVMYYHGQ